ncbi:50S ribosomal protein L10 [Candidatus Nesciobacter abundans]|uniref:Large ribosomal subunit protein uL10 n=1 Tax=Candidatus Nesciobacter abundans TaxID=2601668 RepID=A0A5C0UHQ0_9PROT|nr:50S ribosomal protein L10 [Candidatus Nesciobacter abundans]QEK39230.1 50S ribosomal protein L10 [Candidatus Nesciobacter abundans]
MNTSIKKKLIDDIKKIKLENDFLILTEQSCVSISDLDEIKHELGDGVEIKFVKNSLAKIAIENEEFSSFMKKSNFLVYGKSDPIESMCKVIKASKSSDSVNVKAALIQGDVFDKAGISAISKYKTKNALQATLVGAISSSCSGMVRCMSSLQSSIVRILSEKIKKG